MPASYHITKAGPLHAGVLPLQSIPMPSHASAPALLPKPPLIYIEGFFQVPCLSALYNTFDSLKGCLRLSTFGAARLRDSIGCAQARGLQFTTSRSFLSYSTGRVAPANMSSPYFFLRMGLVFYQLLPKLFT